ncbi:hypothetical protein chiPu_0007611 [Chiloscyllium punctatum]|uniref:Uncharacterized protein n=1 Tax=Chiloscyllium punctatum TaxID=137246 RepID=A0A401SFN2_CHIPU|nr:hypothetical protein [Chiloscyllium punctatum]
MPSPTPPPIQVIKTLPVKLSHQRLACGSTEFHLVPGFGLNFVSLEEPIAIFQPTGDDKKRKHGALAAPRSRRALKPCSSAQQQPHLRNDSAGRRGTFHNRARGGGASFILFPVRQSRKLALQFCVSGVARRGRYNVSASGACEIVSDCMEPCVGRAPRACAPPTSALLPGCSLGDAVPPASLSFSSQLGNFAYRCESHKESHVRTGISHKLSCFIIHTDTPRLNNALTLQIT